MKKQLIITGGSQGIGKAAIKKFMAEGWGVFNLSRQPCELEGVKNIQVDLLVAGWQDIVTRELLAQLPEKSQICLVHNAAMLLIDKVGSIDEKTFHNTLTLNVLVPSALNNLLLPKMAPLSSIIYIGSTLAEKAVPGCASYITSKHALLGLMRATCQDLAGQRIYTCCICPGVTDTTMLRQRCNNNEEVLQRLRELSSDNRFVEPSEIADVIWFSATNPVINGTIIHANLGQIES